MTVNTDIFRRAGVDVATDEKARRAVKVFRALQPTLTAYARNLTKRTDVVVEMAARDNGSTDGKKIYYRPPIALGEDVPHQRRECDKRDDDMLMRCPACRVREEVLVTIYHEIGHIAFDSFAEVSEEDAELTMRKAIEEVGTKYAKKIREALDRAPRHVTGSYIGISNFVSPFLPFLVNCLEDARVNAEMFRARPGTKVMFDSNTRRIFAEGVEQVDRETGELKVVKWCDYPKNAQVTLGTFCIASGYAYEGWFAPDVEEALKDAELNRLVGSIDTVRSAAGVYHLAFPVLARLRELGFCKSDKDPEDEPEEQPEDDAQPHEDDADGGGDREEERPEGDGADVPSPGDSDGDAGAEAGQPDADSAPDEPGDGDPEAADDARADDAAPADEDGADADPAGSDVDDNAEGDSGVDEDDAASVDEGGSAGREPGDDSDRGTGDGGDAAGSDGELAGDEDAAEQPDPDGLDGTGGGSEADRSGPDTEAADGGPGGDPAGEVDTELDGDEAGEAPQSDVPGDGEGGDEPARTGAASDEAAAEEDGDAEPVDTGADAGEGGTELVENSSNDDVPLGDPEDVQVALVKLGDHEEKPHTAQEQAGQDAVDRAIVQGLYFETPSRRIFGVREHHYGSPIIVDGYNTSQAWDTAGSSYVAMGFGSHQLGRDGDFHCAESVLGPALLRMRVAFSDNQRGKQERNLKSGKVNSRALGKRAWNGDERLFRRRIQPGKRDYFVCLGMDVSGSTMGRNIVLEKRAVMAQATLLQRMGIKFAIYAHSGNLHSPGTGRSNGIDLDVYLVKEAKEPWDDKIQQRLLDLGPDSANLDGHFLEYLVRKCDQEIATDKIILYYSDGKMPAENHEEELEILQREIRKCQQKQYTLLGVGIRTDSPKRHGLDTVEVHDDEDIVKVVRHLEKRLH